MVSHQGVRIKRQDRTPLELSLRAPMTPFPGYQDTKYKPPRPRVEAKTPSKALATGVSQWGSSAPRPGPLGPACCPRPLSALGLGRVPTRPPLLRVPAARAGSRGPAPALTSGAAAPGRGGPGRAKWLRVPLLLPRRRLRRRGRGWRLRREAAGQARAPRASSGRASVFSGGGARRLGSRSAPECVPLPARAPGRPAGNMRRRQ